MKLTPFIFIILILLTPCLAGAANSEPLKIIPSNSTLDDITSSTVSSKIKFNSTNETVTVTPEPGVRVTSPTNKPNIQVGVQMIKEGIESVVIDNINDAAVGVGGLQLGALNDTNIDNSQVAIFAIAAHTIDPTKDPAMMDRIATMKTIYYYAILIFAAILALFLIYQQIDPSDSAKLMETATGSYGYVAVSDMVKYYVNTCGWLLLGPGLFFGAIKINNFLVEGQMLSVLDQVVFSSDSIGLYVTMMFLWLISIIFFAIRLVSIVITAHIWIMYGLGFAFKKVRWAAILVTSYDVGLILSQFVIIWVCCVVVSYTTSQTLAWYGVTFVYLGLLVTVVFIEFLFLTWPIFWKILSPRSLSTVIRLARYV